MEDKSDSMSAAEQQAGEVKTETINISSESSSSESEDETKKNERKMCNLRSHFQALAKYPLKGYRQHEDLFTTAIALDDLNDIDLAIEQFSKNHIIPPKLWLTYLKKKYMCAPESTEQLEEFEKQCVKALSSFYDVSLAEFIVSTLAKQPEIKNHLLWCHLLADYGLERPNLLKDFRNMLKVDSDQSKVATIEELMRAICPNWECNADELADIAELVCDIRNSLDSCLTENGSKIWSQLINNHVEKFSVSDALKDALTKLIYEMCLSKFPISEPLWMDYVSWMYREEFNATERGFLGKTTLDVAIRSVHCKPCKSLNHNFLHLMERLKLTAEEVEAKLNQLFEKITYKVDLTVELYLDYLAFRKRQTNNESDSEVEHLREAFQQVWDHLSNRYGDLADKNYEVLQLWAEVEYGFLSNPTRGSEIWLQILSYPDNSSKSRYWLSYAEMEKNSNGIEGTRKILRMAIGQDVIDDIESVAEYYRRFERCYGRYKTIADCQRRVDEYENNRHSWFPKKTRIQLPQRKLQDATTEPQKQRQPKKTFDKPKPNFKYSNATTDPQKQRQPKQTSDDSKPNFKNSNATTDPQKQLHPKQTFDELKPNFKYSTNLEDNKIFIKNLNDSCTKEELEKIYMAIGPVKDVRLVFKKNNPSKGFAYIEFDNSEDALKAVEKTNGMSIGNQTIVVAISNPPRKIQQPVKSQPPPVAQKRRLQTSLIPTTVVRQEEAAKRRRMDEKDEKIDSISNGEDGAAETSLNTSNIDDKQTTESDTSVKKSNADFRKMFLS